jgi:RsiW-degrading membrane proteinase PrsW (M82 family)
MNIDVIRVAAFSTAVVPPLIIAIYFLVAARVQFNDEVVWTGFGFGACTAFPAAVLGQFLGEIWLIDGAPYAVAFNRAFLSASVPEEIFKFFAMMSVCHKYLRTYEPRHLFGLGVLTACGFAGLENIFYIVNVENWGGIALLRAISSVPGHAFVGAVMGYCVVAAVRSGSLTRNNPQILRVLVWWSLALLAPIVLHGLYDFFLMAIAEVKKTGEIIALDQIDDLMTYFVLTVILEGILAHMALNRACQMDNTDKAGFETISPRPPLKWLFMIFEHPVWWGLLGAVCIIFSSLLLALLFGMFGPEHIAENGPAKTGGLGFALFALLHGLAFAGLATTLYRRRQNSNSILIRQSQNETSPRPN